MLPESKRALRQFAFMLGTFSIVFSITSLMDVFVEPQGRFLSVLIILGLHALAALLLVTLIALVIARRSRPKAHQPGPRQRSLR